MNPLQTVIYASALALTSCAQQPKALPSQAPSATTPTQTSNQKPAASSHSLLRRWLQGEFNNNAFVVQQKDEAQKTATGLPENPVEPLHARITQLDGSKLGPNWLLLSLSSAATPDLARSIRFYKLSELAGELKMVGYQLADSQSSPIPNPSQLMQLTLTDLRAEPADCAISWRFLASSQGFTADAPPSHCQSLFGPAARLTLSAQSIEILGASTAQVTDRFEKARRFGVWAQISRGLKSPMPTGKYSVVKGVTLHNQRGRTALLMDDGSASGFALELTEKRDENKGAKSLILRLINEQTGEVEAESWADAKTEALGLNLSWIRISVSAQSAEK